ncbi:uncharacterized protein LOC111215012 isoform X2 [Brassica napus]|uniref:uncharacterized protein LOC111215012 isoform X2 n=1 Tax=Brassica napus TaxID=3708 RepID=UPI002079012D|nr:uncharacterized protein LOC111215012 isoform X2 [Brassica napus]XP_048627971.1 uncharacterized protein LOC111215012 isoform X2 [Brassica napus]
MGNRKNKRVKKQRTDVETEVAEDQFLEDITNREVSDEMEAEEHNQMRTEENEMEEEAEDLEENEMEEEANDDVQTQTDTATTSQRKRRRGPTKMKHIAKDPTERQHVDFTDMGDPCGPGSVLLSSYLGPLVREHVPVIIDNWRQVSEEIKTVLWKSIEMRFDMDEDFKKAAVFKQMGCLWRASKSRLVTSVRKAPTIKARMSLQPNNVSTAEWRKFVKEKTSQAFKVVSDSYKERRQNQIPHTCGRKGMVRLREDLVKSSEDPSKVSRLRVWVKSRTKKDGTPVNVNAAEKIRKASEIELEGHADSTTTNPKNDMLSQILGPDQPGRLRAMGRGISMTKLNCLQVKDNYIAAMEQKQVSLQEQVNDLQKALRRMNNQGPATDVSENSYNKSVNNTRSLPKCYLVDWASVDEKVAEGRVVSAEADELVNGVPLGPHAVKVLVETAIKADTFLWRPAHNMFTMEDAVGEMIAWHSDHCIVATAGLIPEDNAPTVKFLLSLFLSMIFLYT